MAKRGRPKKNVLQQKHYEQLLSASDAKHKEEVREVYERAKNYYKGRQWLVQTESSRFDQLIVDNVIYSNILTVIPSIFFNAPKADVIARTKPNLKNGVPFNPFLAQETYNILLDYYIEELDLRWQHRRCMFDAELAPMAYMFIGHSVKTEIIKDDVLLEVNELIKEDAPFMVRISPDDIRIDVECKDHRLLSANWIAIRAVKRLQDIKDDPKFTNTANLKPNFTVKLDDKKRSRNSEEVSNNESGIWDRVEYWDVWDKKNSRLISIVKGHDGPIRDVKWPLKYEGFPVETLYYNENPDECYPLSPTELDIPNQDEINMTSSLQLDHVRQAASMKIGVRENSLEQDQMDQLEKGPPNVVVSFNQDPNTAMASIKAPNISQDIWLVRRQLKETNREMRGIADFEKGGSSNFSTATEAQVAAQSVGIRRGDKRAQVENFLARIMRKLGQVLQQTLSKTDIRLTDDQANRLNSIAPSKLEKIAGQGGEFLVPWLTVSKEDLVGEFDFNIRVGSIQPNDPDKMQQDAVGFYRLTIQNPMVDQAAVLKHLASTFSGINPDLVLRNPEEVAQEQQQAQQAALQAQQAEGERKSSTDLQKTQMKNQTALQKEQMGNETELLVSTLARGA